LPIAHQYPVGHFEFVVAAGEGGIGVGIEVGVGVTFGLLLAFVQPADTDSRIRRPMMQATATCFMIRFNINIS
jgi:hypothetical protein